MNAIERINLSDNEFEIYMLGEKVNEIIDELNERGGEQKTEEI